MVRCQGWRGLVVAWQASGCYHMRTCSEWSSLSTTLLTYTPCHSLDGSLVLRGQTSVSCPQLRPSPQFGGRTERQCWILVCYPKSWILYLPFGCLLWTILNSLRRILCNVSCQMKNCNLVCHLILISFSFVTVLGHRAVGNSTFRRYWKQLVPNIVIGKPMTDLCWMCQKNNYAIYRSSNLPDCVKSAKLRKQEDHLCIVARERMVYKEMSESCKISAKHLNVVLGPNPPCSRNITMHYSFDYAQQVSYTYALTNLKNKRWLIFK